MKIEFAKNKISAFGWCWLVVPKRFQNSIIILESWKKRFNNRVSVGDLKSRSGERSKRKWIKSIRPYQTYPYIPQWSVVCDFFFILRVLQVAKVEFRRCFGCLCFASLTEFVIFETTVESGNCCRRWNEFSCRVLDFSVLIFCFMIRYCVWNKQHTWELMHFYWRCKEFAVPADVAERRFSRSQKSLLQLISWIPKWISAVISRGRNNRCQEHHHRRSVRSRRCEKEH